MLKHEDAKALVHAMFGSTKKSKSAEPKMISGAVQLAYSEAFGVYPPEDESRSFWVGKLREIANALANRCRHCGGKGKFEYSECAKCEGTGFNDPSVECSPCDGAVRKDVTSDDADVIPQIKSILAKFGIKDSQSCTKATICLDYDHMLVGVSVTKKMLAFSENKTIDRH